MLGWTPAIYKKTITSGGGPDIPVTYKVNHDRSVFLHEQDGWLEVFIHARGPFGSVGIYEVQCQIELLCPRNWKHGPRDS